MSPIKHTRALLLLLTICAFMLAGCAAAAKTNLVPAAASSKLTVTVLDVGQGDAILVQTDGKNVLVDAGPRENSGKLVRSLKSHGVTRIDILIATHPHADHIGGMGAVLEAFGVGKVYDTGQLTAAKTYGNFLKTIKSKKIQLELLRAPSRIPIGREGAALEVIMPAEPFLQATRSDLNSNSAVMRLVYRNFSMLLAADATSEAEERMLAVCEAGKLKADVLKVPHHTSRHSNTVSWLETVKPEAAIATYARENDGRFPHRSTLKRLEKLGARYFNTADNGSVKVLTDGDKYEIRTEK